MAGALGVELGGAASYEGVMHERPLFGTGRRPDSTDLARALQIYLEACALLWALALASAVGVALWPR
jgi:adenosylcobinamide-phosphate synthase